MWTYLEHIYHQENSARYCQLGFEIAEYTWRDKSIQDYYSRFMNFWIEFIELVCAAVPDMPFCYSISSRDFPEGPVFTETSS